jgi:hypothetical protein
MARPGMARFGGAGLGKAGLGSIGRVNRSLDALTGRGLERLGLAG